MNETQKLFEILEDLTPEFIQVWQDIVNIESPTDYKEGVDRVGEYLVNFAKREGFQTEVFSQSVAGNPVCITMNADKDQTAITLSAHADTVHPLSNSKKPVARIENDTIFGPGVCDCKGGIVASLMTMKALKEIGFNKRPIQFILQTDEETGSATSNRETINYIIEKAKNSIAFLNCESTRGNSAVLWRRGICRYYFTVTGESAHASRCAERGASAILEAAHKIIELEKMKDPNALTCNCGIINGGNAPNTVPDKCSFVAEIRFDTNEQWAEGEKTVKEICERSFIKGTHSEFKKVPAHPAMQKEERNFLLLEKMNEIYKKCSLPILTARQSLGGSDAAFITCAGIPCVDSVAVDGDFIHTPREYARVSSLLEAAKRLSAVCLYL